MSLPPFNTHLFWLYNSYPLDLSLKNRKTPLFHILTWLIFSSGCRFRRWGPRTRESRLCHLWVCPRIGKSQVCRISIHGCKWNGLRNIVISHFNEYPVWNVRFSNCTFSWSLLGTGALVIVHWMVIHRHFPRLFTYFALIIIKKTNLGQNNGLL